MAFYVISTSYIGPNQHTVNDARNILDGDYYEICTTPGITNMSKEVRIDGWLGSTNDWSKTAHGEFETIEAARAKIEQEIGRPISECRTAPAGGRDDDLHESVAERYYTSIYEHVTDADYWVGLDGITADTTDDQIAKMVAEAKALAAAERTLIIGDATDWLTRHRDDLKADAEDAA